MENEIPYQVIKQITNNYEDDRRLGSGGFATVYKAVLDGKTIAVKVFDVPRFDDSEFRNEFDNLKRLKHGNIVELVGFCNDTEEVVYTDDDGKHAPAEKLHLALCLEYVQNGHLGDYISDESTGLIWHTRYKIIKGVCEALKYLHDGISPRMLHLDLKPQNILLDKDMIPKIIDFGLSRLFTQEKPIKTESTCGTIGYIPPEYTNYQVISEKFDIYSLGVIMAKTIAGREQLFRIGDVPRKKFINNVCDNWKKRLHQYFTSDRSLEVYCQQIRRCTELALNCMKKNSHERPTIQEIVSSLTETETMIRNLGLHIQQFPHGASTLPKVEIPENASPENDLDTDRTETQESTPMELSLHSLEKFTDNFSQEREISQHVFGTVYKGILEDSQVIAVVKFKPNSAVGRDRKFSDKVESLSGLNHENIVKILGYCREARRKFVEINGRQVVVDMVETLLCHEYFSAGSLAEYIDGHTSTGESCRLEWDLGFKMIVGICQGLHFLHNELRMPIIHSDLKPENIFLDNNMDPKIFYFVHFDEQTIVTGPMRSSAGYMAPEYLYKGQISSQIDIYSLGIIILEIIAGTRNHRTVDQEHARRFIENVRKNWTDEYIMHKYPSLDECRIGHIKMCIEIGLKCVEVYKRKRPSIVEIVDKLNIISKELVKYELLEVHPRELCFPFEPKKLISCSLQLRNKGDDYVAFMVVPETPESYLTKLPLCGVIPPNCTYTHTITMCKQLQQKPQELLTLHTVAVGQFDLQFVHKDTIAEKYGNFFNKAKEETNGDHEVQALAITVNCDPPVQEPTRPTIETIRTNYAREVSSIDVHPTEPWIMTTSRSMGSLHVWNNKTMERLVHFNDVINDPVCVAKFIGREKWLVTGDAYGGIHVYSYDEHEEVEHFNAHSSCIASLAVHPTCPFLLSSSEDEDHLIKLWDWDKNWQCTRTFLGHADKVTQVIFNSNIINTFTSASFDGTVKIWSVDKDDADITLDEKEGSLLCVENFEQKNEQHLIAGCMDGTAQIWNMEIKGCVGKLEHREERITAVSLHPVLPLLITGSFDGTVRIWKSDTYKLANIIDFNLGQVNAFGFIKELRRIVVGCQQGMATVEIPVRR